MSTEPNNQQLSDEEIFRNFQSSVHLSEGKAPHVFVVLGASVTKCLDNELSCSLIFFFKKGDLAKKKIYPTLW